MGTVELDDLTQTAGEWLRGSGPEADIVISSRIRLARNLADFPFISRATRAGPRRGSRRRCASASWASRQAERTALRRRGRSSANVDRQFLVERHLISREHAEGQGARAVAIDRREKFSLMINEEDHLRIQVMQSGLDLQSAWEQINRIDDLIEEQVTYAFHERLGYLTACPTNVGTGMRVSVMLHLPALVHHPADRQGLPQPAEDQPGGPRPLRRRLAGDGRLLPDQQPDHPRARARRS